MSYVCGTGNWGGPVAGDPDNNIVLSAQTAYGGIEVSWTYPETYPEAVAHFKVMRSPTNDFADAGDLVTVSGSRYLDRTALDIVANTTYWYWIQIVSVHGTKGAYIGPASAIAYIPVAQTLELLTGAIDDSILALSLKTEIDKITLNHADLLAEVQARIAGNTSLSTALAQTQTNVNQALTFISSEASQRIADNAALVDQIDTVAAFTAGNTAAIITEQQARTDADSAIALSVSTVAASIGSRNKSYSQTTPPAGLLVDGDTWFDTDDNNKIYRWSGASWDAVSDLRIAANSAALSTETSARVDADSALSNQITTSQTVLNGNIASAQTALQTNINTVAGKVTGIGALYSAKVTVNGLVGGFGIYNDGTTIDAGFDVDTFWVGKTNGNKRKPFIISGGVTYIDDAAIRNLTFDKLTATDGSAVIEGGKLTANYIDGRNLSIKDALGNVILSAGVQLSGTYIANASITTAKVANAAIGDAQIGGNIQSSNWNGTVGWLLDRSGNIYAKNGNFSGDITGASGTFSGQVSAGSIDLQKLAGVSYSYTTPGTYSYTTTAEYTTISVAVRGGGGGGAVGHPTYNTGGSGGNGGSYIATFTNVAAGTVLTITVGGSGAGGLSSPFAGLDGGNSSVVGGSINAVASGGSGGPYASFSNGSPGSGGGTGGTGLGSPGGIRGTYYFNGEVGVSNPGTPGGSGTVVIEAYNAQGVVTKAEWSTLMTHLNQRFSTYTWP